MMSDGTSTSVSLLYSERPVLNFVRYVDNLERALRESRHSRFALRWDNDDFVVFDIDGSRVVLGYCDLKTEAAAVQGPDPAFAAVLVMAVGPGLQGDLSTRLADNASDLCKSVIERIQVRHAADLILWTETPGVFTADHFDSLVDAAIKTPVTEAEPLQRVADTAAPAVSDRFGEIPVARLMARLETEIRPRAVKATSRTTARPKLPDFSRPKPVEAPAAPAPVAEVAVLEAAAPRAVVPTRPQARDDMARIREALYPPEPENAPPRKREPMVRRVTLYSLNATLLLAAPPVGAALLTYNLLGRENARLTSRVMALTGAAFAVAKAFGLRHMGLGT